MSAFFGSYKTIKHANLYHLVNFFFSATLKVASNYLELLKPATLKSGTLKSSKEILNESLEPLDSILRSKICSTRKVIVLERVIPRAQNSHGKEHYHHDNQSNHLTSSSYTMATTSTSAKRKSENASISKGSDSNQLFKKSEAASVILAVPAIEFKKADNTINQKCPGKDFRNSSKKFRI